MYGALTKVGSTSGTGPLKVPGLKFTAQIPTCMYSTLGLLYIGTPPALPLPLPSIPGTVDTPAEIPYFRFLKEKQSKVPTHALPNNALSYVQSRVPRTQGSLG